jgi:hypothetical protein
MTNFGVGDVAAKLLTVNLGVTGCPCQLGDIGVRPSESKVELYTAIRCRSPCAERCLSPPGPAVPTGYVATCSSGAALPEGVTRTIRAW